MNEEHEPEEEEEQPAPVPPPMNPIQGSTEPAPPDRDRDDAEDRETHRPHGTIAEICVAVFTGLYFVATVVLIFLAAANLKDARNSGKEMAGKLDDAVGKLSTAVEALKTGNAQSDTNAKASNELTDRSIAAAERGLTLTSDNFKKAERPWIGPIVAQASAVSEVGKRPRMEMNFINTGRTIALNVKYCKRIDQVEQEHLVKRGEHPAECRGGGPEDAPVGMLIPNGTMSVAAEAPFLHSQIGIDNVARGTRTLYFNGWISYDDSVGEKHHTTFCMKLLPGEPRGRVGPCPWGGNRAY